MQIFIDESGTFAGSAGISASGALVVPDQQMGGFEKLFGRLRKHLPQEKGEVKGRLLNEEQVGLVCGLLHKIGCIFEVVIIDLAFSPGADVDKHKRAQEEKMTENLTDEHHETLVEEVKKLRNQLKNTPTQLYIQSVTMAELIYNTINNANIYYSFRLPRELGEYNWTIDAKEKDKKTPWEEWWYIVLLPMLESKSFRKPFIAVEGANYKWHDRFKAEIGDYKRQFVKDAERGTYFDIRMIMNENFRFSSAAEFGLEAVDILTNAIRRSLAGNFSREGWLPIRKLMVHRQDHYIKMISLSSDEATSPKVSYARLLDDFRSGGRSMLPS